MKSIFLLIDGRRFGPYKMEQISRWITEGRVKKDTLCWYEGLDGWKRAEVLFPQFFSRRSVYGEINSQKDSRNKRVGCFGWLLRIGVVLGVFVGLYLLISPYVYDFIEDKSFDVKYKNPDELKIDFSNLRRLESEKKVVKWGDGFEKKIDYHGSSLDIFSPFKGNTQKVKISKVGGIKVKNGLLLSSPLDIELDEATKENFPAKIEFNNLDSRIFRGYSPLCVAIKKGEIIDYPLSFMKRNKLVVLTDHFTTFLPIQFKSNLDYSPVMKIPSYFIYKKVNLSPQKSVRMIKNYKKNIKYIMPSAANDYWNTFNEWLGITSNITSFSENAMYMEGFKSFNELMPEFGLALSFFQLGIDVYNGKNSDAVFNFTKSLSYYGIGKAIPTRAMNIAMVGVFVIDYSLNKFMNEAISGRERLYERIGSRWLFLRRKKGEKGPFWYKRLKSVINLNRKHPERIGEAIENSFRSYVSKLWNNDTEIALLQSELGGSGFTGGGGLNEDLKKRLSDELLLQLKLYNKSVLEKLCREYLVAQEKYTISVKKRIVSFLNKKHLIKIVLLSKNGDRIKNLKDVEVGFIVKNRSLRKFWRKKTKKSGKALFMCTNLGYINAGFPHVAYVKVPVGDGRFWVVKKKFILKDSKPTIIKFVLKNGDISGVWQGYFQVTKITYFDSLMKIAPYIFKILGIGKNATERLAMAGKIFEVPENIKRKRFMKVEFKTLGKDNLYKAVLEGDEGRVVYKGKYILKDGLLVFKTSNRTGDITFKGRVISNFLINGNFILGNKFFPMGKGRWTLKRKK